MANRITTDEQLNELVSRISKVLPEQTEEAVNDFLTARYVKYNSEKKQDSFIKLKAGNTYLPYPYNSRFVGALHTSVESDTEDPYDI